MYATNYAIQKLVYEVKLKIDSKIVDIIPDFDEFDDMKINMTVRNLLNHTAGFIADPQYHNENYLHAIKEKDGSERNLLDQYNDGKNDVYTQDKNLILDMIKKTPLEYAPGTKNIYSDVDYMLLGILVEKISRLSFESYL